MFLHTYKSSSGRDLIMEYIDSLTEPERVDAFSVLECMENGEFDKIVFKQWERKVYEVYFRKHNRIFMWRQMRKTYTYYMLVENRKIRQKKQIKNCN